MIIESQKSPEQKVAEARMRQEAEAKRFAEAAEEAKREAAALPVVTVGDLASAYAENTVAADMRFKGKKYKISGVVTDINTDLFGAPYLVLRGGVNQFMEPQFSFSKDDMSRLAGLRKGTKVVLVCKGRGDVAKIPMSDECILVQ